MRNICLPTCFLLHRSRSHIFQWWSRGGSKLQNELYLIGIRHPYQKLWWLEHWAWYYAWSNFSIEMCTLMIDFPYSKIHRSGPSRISGLNLLTTITFDRIGVADFNQIKSILKLRLYSAHIIVVMHALLYWNGIRKGVNIFLGTACMIFICLYFPVIYRHFIVYHWNL